MGIALERFFLQNVSQLHTPETRCITSIKQPGNHILGVGGEAVKSRC